ncbi:hypothetical protein A5N17_06280 [Arthrobacter sp. D2]|nr:hypothetical protein [Arthrobacter sp. M5]NKR16471.1 hypothetical protein [Arthrobacter sp. M6]OEH61420.1 hypothetical protein A5N13_16885 [Arthrobacter sp. D4]OEH64406.1 hypothetical protein A5N17_06280 [Arthrobacter sp. D2]
MRAVRWTGRARAAAGQLLRDRPADREGRSAVRRRFGGLRILVTLVLVLALLLIIAVVVFGVMLLTNAEAVLSWLDGILRQVQRIPFIGGEDSSGGG